MKTEADFRFCAMTIFLILSHDQYNVSITFKRPTRPLKNCKKCDVSGLFLLQNCSHILALSDQIPVQDFKLVSKKQTTTVTMTMMTTGNVEASAPEGTFL